MITITTTRPANVTLTSLGICPAAPSQRESMVGFDSMVQFQVALELAQGFHHHWAEPTWCEVRKDLGGGLVKLEDQMILPQTPWEALKASQYRLDQGYGQFAAYTTPTHQWESGSGTFKVSVRKNGAYTIIHDGVVREYVDRKGRRTLTPQFDWVSWKKAALHEERYFEPSEGHHYVHVWQSTQSGRGESLGQALVLAVARCERRGYDVTSLVEAFEASPKFWKTGHQAGTRWWLKAI